MNNTNDSSKKQITLGILIGLAFGIPILIVILLLIQPWNNNASPAPTLTATLENEVTAADLTPTQSPTSPPAELPAEVTPTPTATSESITYTVQAGDVLGSIALEFDVTLEDLLAANGLSDADMIIVGQTLIIPTGETPLETAEPVVEEEPTSEPVVTISDEGWTPSILQGDLSTAYPGNMALERFTIHYTPGTYPERDLETVTAILQQGLAHIERTLNAEIDGTFDIYVAGSLFAAPDQALRGRSFSAARRYFFLHDGTGNLNDQLYIATHEMTHLFSWNVFGRPVSAMLSEGVAVHTGMEAIASADHIPIDAYCAAYLKADQLPRVSGSLSFNGHIRDLENYYAAGCFVQYLIETYGPEKFGELYPTGNYSGVYGQSLAALESEWIADLESQDDLAYLDAEALIAATDAVGAAYDQLFPGFTGTSAQWAAYQEVDAARMALLEGRFEDVTAHLSAFEEVLEE